MSTRLDLTPWLAGVFVLPEHRGRGVGERLVAHAMSWAAAQRVETLHLYTRDAVALYQKLGWLESGREFYEGREVQLMVFHPGRADRREREARARSFDAVAALYDEVRPRYPSALIEDVLEWSTRLPELPALEVGAGTGIASRAFARRAASRWPDASWRGVAVEPGPDMADIWRAHSEGEVELRVVAFERAALAPSSFGLLFSVQAFHWVDPARRLERAHRVLAPGGCLAIFGNAPAHGETAARRAIESVYANAGDGFDNTSLAAAGHWYSADSPFWPEIQSSPLFEECELRQYEFVLRYSAERYCDLLRTHSDHARLPEEQRVRLLAGVCGAIEAHGGVLEVPYVATAFLARRSEGATA